MRGVALVTGAARGLGAAVAHLLAENGFQVLVTARELSAAETVAAGLPGEDHRAVQLDVTRSESVERVIGGLDGLDVLISNAGAYVDWSETGLHADLDEARRVFETNLYAPWHLAQVALPLLAASAHPRLVLVASGAGSHGEPVFGLRVRGGRAASYGISKAALLALTSTLAAELIASPVRINAVDPGLTATFDGAEAMGARPVSDGAASIVWAVDIPDDGPTGGFFRDGQPLPW